MLPAELARDTTLETIASGQLIDTFAYISPVPSFKLIQHLESASASTETHNQEWANYKNLRAVFALIGYQIVHEFQNF